MSFSSFSDNWTLANSRRGTFVTLNSLPWHQIWDTGEPGWLLPCKAPTSAQNALLRKLKESGLSALNHWPLRVSHSHSSCWIPLLGRDLLYGATNRWIYGRLETRMDNTAPSRDQPQQHLLSMASQCTWNLSSLDGFFPFKQKFFAAGHLFLEIRSNLRTDIRCRDRGTISSEQWVYWYTLYVADSLKFK